MLEFKIDWKMPCAFTTDERNRPIWKLRLNNQWSIACIISIKKLRTITWTIESIEIHRKNTAGKFSIHGVLTLREFQQNISHIILTGASTVQISSSVNIKIPPYRYANLYGFVNISDMSEKQASGLANRKLKEVIQLMSIGELSNDFEPLLEPGTSFLSDVTLKCGGISIPAHKTILSARSPVFAAMFAHPMKESTKNEVDITDVDEPVLRNLLMYLYTGKPTSDLSFSSAADLLIAADKYQLQGLKSVCCYSLKKSVSFKTVWKMLVLGDMLCEDLKSFAMDCICFMCCKISVLESTKEWKALKVERPDLALEVKESFPMDDNYNTCDNITALESAEGWKALLKEMPDLTLELSNDLERLLEPESSCFADVTLKCASASIPAHKIILSARSSVFAAMFSKPMKESPVNEVDIFDIDEPVLRHLLKYLYTGKTTDLTFSSAADLLLAADKYQLQDLKMVCSHFLKETVSFKTVWRMLVLDDLLFEDLKSFAIGYICNLYGEASVLESTEEWKSLREERPKLALEVSESFAMDHICNTCGKITDVESELEWKVLRKEKPNLALDYSKLLELI